MNRLTRQQKVTLQYDVTEEEVKEEMFAINEDKAPRWF